MAAAHPTVVAAMMQKMEGLAATIWTPEGGHSNDPLCHAFDMKHYGGFYGPWKELGEWCALPPTPQTNMACRC